MKVIQFFLKSSISKNVITHFIEADTTINFLLYERENYEHINCFQMSNRFKKNNLRKIPFEIAYKQKWH